MPHTGGNSVCPETVFRYLMQRDESLLVNISKGGVANLIHSPTQASRNKNVFFLSFSKEEKHHSMIYDWRLVAPASSPFDNYPKKKIKRREQRENGLQGDGMCFWKRICADGWVSETEQKESASTPDNWLWRTWIPFLSFLSGAFQKKNNNQNSIECRYFRASLRGILGTTYTTTAQVYKRRRCQSALLKNKKKNRYTIDGDCGR